MDHTNDPMERVSERVVSRRTLLVTCCSEHVGNNAEGVPWTPTVPSNLRRESRGYQQNNRNTKIFILPESYVNSAHPIYAFQPPRMQCAPSAASTIGPIVTSHDRC